MSTHRLVPSSSTVYTPERLASAMVKSIGDGRDVVWLDPCAGEGVFVAAIAQLGVPPERLLSLDLFRRQSTNDAFAQTVRGVDFISWASHHPSSIDRIVMNPPYVTLGRLSGAPLRRALRVTTPDGTALSLGANYWCAFVLSALRCLRSDGRMAVVLPAAWDYARYAGPVRDAVYAAFREVVVLRSSTPIFMPTAKEGAIVVVGRDRGQTSRAVRRVDVENAERLAAELEGLANSPPLRGSTVIRYTSRSSPPTVPLRDLVDIRIGAVTGDARYFLVRESTRLEFKIPRAAFRPVVTRSKHLVSAFMGKVEWQSLLDDDERVWLFRPSESILSHPAVRRYIAFGEAGGCNIEGHKVIRRPVWYRTPLPRTPDAFLSGMSTLLPWLSFREMPELTATNTLYTLRFRRMFESAARWTLAVLFLTSHVRSQLRRHGRLYPGGLLKFEPENLYSLNVPWPVSTRGARSVLRESTSCLLSGNERDAEELADAWLEERLVGRRRNGANPARALHRSR